MLVGDNSDLREVKAATRVHHRSSARNKTLRLLRYRIPSPVWFLFLWYNNKKKLMSWQVTWKAGWNLCCGVVFRQSIWVLCFRPRCRTRTEERTSCVHCGNYFLPPLWLSVGDRLFTHHGWQRKKFVPDKMFWNRYLTPFCQFRNIGAKTNKWFCASWLSVFSVFVPLHSVIWMFWFCWFPGGHGAEHALQEHVGSIMFELFPTQWNTSEAISCPFSHSYASFLSTFSPPNFLNQLVFASLLNDNANKKMIILIMLCVIDLI